VCVYEMQVRCVAVFVVVAAACVALGSAEPFRLRPDLSLAADCLVGTVPTAKSAGCFVYELPDFPKVALVAYKYNVRMQDPTKTYSEAVANQWAMNIHGMFVDLAKTASGKKLLDFITTANPTNRKAGYDGFPQTPRAVKDKGFNLVLAREHGCEDKLDFGGNAVRMRVDSAANAVDKPASSDPHKGSDSVFIVETCDYSKAGTNPFKEFSHEIVHAYHHIKGIRDDCRCCEELRTVGVLGDVIGEFGDDISENKIAQQYATLTHQPFVARPSYPCCESITNKQTLTAECAAGCTQLKNGTPPPTPPKPAKNLRRRRSLTPK